MNNPIDIIFSVLVLIFSIVVHEVSHGVAALTQGDETAKNMGRLTLNPIKHIDLLGSIVLPILCVIMPGNVLFGWAKPVPVNYSALKNGRKSVALVALAGPLSNIILIALSSIILKIWGGLLPDPALYILSIFIITNLVLAIFNLIPIPPLDGSKILWAIAPEKAREYLDFMERYGFLAVIIFIVFLWQYFAPIILFIYRFLVS